MHPFTHFLLDALSRLGVSIVAGTLVSCLVMDDLATLHLVLFAIGLLMTAAGYPARHGPNRGEA